MSDNRLYDAVREALDEARKAARAEYLGFPRNSDDHLARAAQKLHDAIRDHTLESIKALAEGIARA